MQQPLGSPKEQSLPAGVLTLRTTWPQWAAGIVFAGTLLFAASNPGLTAFTFVIGTGMLFALTLAYLYATRRGLSKAITLLTWTGGVVLAIFSALIAPNFLPFSILFVFAGVCYGLGASSRRAMLVGTVIAWMALAASFVIHVAVMAGVLNIGFTYPPLIVEAGMCIVCLLIAADTMQRLWRHYNRTESAFRDLHIANNELTMARITLERHVQEQEQLLEVSRVIRSTQDMEPLLDEILSQMKHVVDYCIASVVVLRQGGVVAVRTLGREVANAPLLLTALIATPQWQRMIAEKQPIVLPDIFQEWDFLEPFDRMLAPEKKEKGTNERSWMGLPLIVRGEVVGAFSITHSEPGFFTPDRVKMAFAFANHAAVAIESSRTREEAVNAAAFAERARLARELHDSVSQALYGMVLTTRTSLELMDRNPVMARDSMRYTLELADAALSEMRALIFELRPETLKEDGLLIAFRKQAAALTARHKIDLQLDLCSEEPALPIESKEALYRITLEAIQNTIRHAGATQLRLTLDCDDGVTLIIEDNGCGFNVQSDYPGHLGLQSMRERAHALGGDVTITSAPGQGTCVRIHIAQAQPALLTPVSAAV